MLKEQTTWQEKKLGEIIKLEYGKPLPDSKRKPDGAYPAYGANGEKKRTDEYYYDKPSIIVGRKGSAGEINLTEEKFWPLDVTYFVTFDNNKYHLNFIWHLLSFLELPKLAKGVKPGINRNEVYAISVRIPPISTQQRIAAIIDKAFAAIEKAKSNAEQNLKNSNELFESDLRSVFENKGGDWEEKKLIEITTKIGSGATPRGGNKSYKTEGIFLIRSMNVHDFEFKERNIAFIDEQQAKELNNVALQENDILLNITGASVARCCVIPKKYLPARVNQHVSIIRAKKEIIDPIFLNLLLISKCYKDQLLFTSEQGATRQAITKAQLEDFKITFPKSLKIQQSIVHKLNILSVEIKKLGTIYQNKINELDELKKSILQKAFSGKLTAQETSYEPTTQHTE